MNNIIGTCVSGEKVWGFGEKLDVGRAGCEMDWNKFMLGRDKAKNR